MTSPSGAAVVSLSIIGLVLLSAVLITAPLEHAARGVRDEYEQRASYAWLTAAAPSLIPEDCSDTDPANAAIDVDGLAGLPLWCRGTVADGVELMAVKLTTSEGYNGTIELVVVVRGSAEVIRIVALEHAETIGFGAELLDPHSPFLQGFYQSSIVPELTDLDGVSGATFTARAARHAVAKVINANNKNKNNAK